MPLSAHLRSLTLRIDFFPAGKGQAFLCQKQRSFAYMFSRAPVNFQNIHIASAGIMLVKSVRFLYNK